MNKRLVISMTLFPFLMSVGCATDENKNTTVGAGVGAAAGALVGGIIGHQTGRRNEGALIGAALGGTIGGVAGHRMDKQAKELAQIAETKRTDQGLITKLKSDILFDTGKSDLKPAAQDSLKKMADIMKKYPENILDVQGYTDSTGSLKVNEQISMKRAEAVRSTLIANGMPSQTITAKGLGPANPVAENTTADGRQKNRRVEIQVTVDESKVPKDAKASVQTPAQDLAQH
jgi:outer membrane protein OmpA-like peptidoglycan-associated protein